jgi:hypothetical protein
VSDSAPGTEVSQSRLTDVGSLPVHRALPTHGRRTIGAWCFLDHFGPVEVTEDLTMMVGPHPHIGLHTVTWLLEGAVVHTDSLGHQQEIRPGQLNLMTAGHGIAHAEDGRNQRQGPMEGVQLWVAQPDATRHSRPAFAHHPHLPVIDLGRGQATVLLGEFAGVESPGQVDMPLVGLDVTGSESLELPLEPRFEYGVIVLRGHLRFQDVTVSPDELLSLGRGQDGITLDLAPDSRAILLGGEPLEEEIFMWWNFVGRDRTEMERARADWQAASERFGAVDSTLTRIDAPHPFWRPEGAM